MGSAWRQVHAAEGKLVTDGLYARVRHPQYSAMFLLIVSLLIQWPTLLTVLMSPILFVVYFRLAKREEREMEAHASRGPAYLDYKSTVPALLPRLSTRIAMFRRRHWHGKLTPRVPGLIYEGRLVRWANGDV
jgi:protein-S-isoprenylcysteine O-methyltransferase Ste14